MSATASPGWMFSQSMSGGCMRAIIAAHSPMSLVLALLFAAASANSGYLDDRQCATCHAGIAQTYKHVGMSKAFYRPRPDDAIEDFAKPPLRHEKSGDVMQLRWRDGKLLFTRWQLDDAGNR